MTLTINIPQMRAEIASHIANDQIISNRNGGFGYWSAKKQRGCFIGCLTHSADPRKAEERFGVPVAIMLIAENIFEALPIDAGRSFFGSFGDAVAVDGKDLSRVHWAWLAEELRSLPVTTSDVQAVINPVIAGMDLLAAGKDWPEKAAADAAGAAYAAAAAAADADSAAHAAAHAAAYAAVSAARSAADAAAYAARAADVAAYAAYAAADAADAAYAADAAARQRQAANLLRLIAEAPIGGAA